MYCLIFHPVFVEEPWPPNVFIPSGSDSMVVNCTGSKNQCQVWSIILPGPSAVSQFYYQDTVTSLNNNGINEMPGIELELTRTIRLCINDTEGKNGTKIHCVNPATAYTISATTLTGELILLPKKKLNLTMLVGRWRDLQGVWSGRTLINGWALRFCQSQTIRWLQHSISESFNIYLIVGTCKLMAEIMPGPIYSCETLH